MHTFCKAFKMHIRGGGGVQGQESPSTSEVTIQETLGEHGACIGKKVREKGLRILADTLFDIEKKLSSKGLKSSI